MPITKLMDGLPSRTMNQQEFDAATEQLMVDLPLWGEEANALQADVGQKQVAAAQSAQLASGKAAAALGSATAAEESAQHAQSRSQLATQMAESAEQAATRAQISAVNAGTLITATSNSALVPAVGVLAFEIVAGKAFAFNAPVRASSRSNAGKFVDGTVASYEGTTLTVKSTRYEGVGLVDDWVITVTGPGGRDGGVGGVNGGNLQGALNAKRGIDLASAATLDVWNAGGDYLLITGTVATTVFAEAPQAGASRRLLVGGAWPITAGANVNIKGVVSGATFVCAAGDEIEIYAETTTKFRLTVFRASGLPDSGYLEAVEQAASGQASESRGGSGQEVVRILNTLVVNTIAGASLSANRLTLPAGTYKVAVLATARCDGVHRARLWNVTDASMALFGSTSGGYFSNSASHISGRLSLASAKVFEIRHYGTSDSDGVLFGPPTSQPGVPEMHAYIKIEKVG